MSRVDHRTRVRRATPRDADSWARLRHTFWPEGTEAEHRADAEAFFADSTTPQAVLLAEVDAGIVGFAEGSIGPYAEGCQTDRVGYLDGWFVVAEARSRGVGRRLVAAAEEWARAQGCAEFASDAEVANEASAAAHRVLGFTDVGLVRCFKKDL